MEEQVRSSVWLGLLDAQRLVLYYTKLFEKHSRIQGRIEKVVAVFGSLGLVSLAAQLNEAVPVVSVVIGSAAVLYSGIGNHATKAAYLYLIRCECADLETQWAELWDRVQSGLVEDSEALERSYALRTNSRIATDKASLVGLSIDHKANQAAWVEAIAIKTGEYA